MKKMSQKNDWEQDDATWALLEKAAPKQASDRFADDVVRTVRTMPEKESIWAGIFGYAPWIGAVACAVLAAFILFNQPGDHPEAPKMADVSTEAEWSEIEDVADAEILSAAAEHLDDFSDDELIAMIGF